MAAACLKHRRGVMRMRLDTTLAQHWFAVQVSPNKEDAAASILRNKGYEIFLPASPASPTARKRPLFPGYLFCRFGMNIVGPLLTTPGVIRLLGIGNRPEPVEDEEIADIQRIQESGLAADRCSFPEVGQEVAIVSGPLNGLKGIVLTCERPDCLIVSVTLLHRSVSVRLHPSWAVAVCRRGKQKC